MTKLIFFANCELPAICDDELYPSMSKFTWYLSEDFHAYRYDTGKYGCSKIVWWNDDVKKLKNRTKLRVVK